jgi:spore germination protein YaaH
MAIKFLKNIFLFCLLVTLNTLCFASENIFYVLRYSTPDRMTPPKNTLASLKKHYKKIDILIPQAYTINELGEINKEIEPELYKFAREHSMKIMPLVTNTQFNREAAHQFLSDADAQAKALKTLVDLCKKNHFYGIQLDFEMINIKDRDALTRFYELAANELHRNEFLISFAVAPTVTEKPTSLFLKKIYENWEGAYDLKKIGEFSDFVSIMAYNQHGGGLTTPGPTASLSWVKETVKYTLQYISANKISIGIADYSTHWFTGSTKVNEAEKIAVQMRGVDYETGTSLARQNKSKFIWDNQSATHYAIFTKNWLNEYIFIEDAKSFTAKYRLVKKYKLRGISVFDLGTEDQSIWKKL